MYRYKAHRVFYIYFIQHSRRFSYEIPYKNDFCCEEECSMSIKTIDLVPVFTGADSHHLSYIRLLWAAAGVYFI